MARPVNHLVRDGSVKPLFMLMKSIRTKGSIAFLKSLSDDDKKAIIDHAAGAGRLIRQRIYGDLEENRFSFPKNYRHAHLMIMPYVVHMAECPLANARKRADMAGETYLCLMKYCGFVPKDSDEKDRVLQTIRTLLENGGDAADCLDGVDSDDFIFKRFVKGEQYYNDAFRDVQSFGKPFDHDIKKLLSPMPI